MPFVKFEISQRLLPILAVFTSLHLCVLSSVVAPLCLLRPCRVFAALVLGLCLCFFGSLVRSCSLVVPRRFLWARASATLAFEKALRFVAHESLVFVAERNNLELQRHFLLGDTNFVAVLNVFPSEATWRFNDLAFQFLLDQFACFLLFVVAQLVGYHRIHLHCKGVKLSQLVFEVVVELVHVYLSAHFRVLVDIVVEAN